MWHKVNLYIWYSVKTSQLKSEQYKRCKKVANFKQNWSIWQNGVKSGRYLHNFISMCWFPSGASGRERTIGAILHGQGQMNFRKPIKESHDFRPSWQARLGAHSWQDTEDEGVARLKPRHESAKTPFRNDLLARDWLLNQLRYRQLRIHLPVKRVEIHTGKQKYGTGGSASTCNSGDAYEKHSEIRRQNKDRIKHSSVTGTGQRETRMAI